MTNKTIYDVRRNNLADWLKEPGAKTALAIKLGVTQARVSHMLKATGPGARLIYEDTAREIETALGKAVGALDVDPEAPTPAKGVLNTALLEACVRAVTTATAKAKVKADAEKTAFMVAAVYERSAAKGAVDMAFVEQMVNLMK